MNRTFSLEKYTEVVTLQDGVQVTFRPIVPEDAPLLQEGFARLSPQTIYYRFLETARQMSDAQARSLATVDYHKRMALVGAIQEDGQERLVFVARYAMIEDTGEPGLAEAAIVVRDDYQKRGLGKLAMQRLVEYARQHDVTAFVGAIHTSNAPILRFIKSSGLPYQRKMIEPGVWELRIQLARTEPE
jgi:GNAT superfamily N-acetyltransferase